MRTRRTSNQARPNGRIGSCFANCCRQSRFAAAGTRSRRSTAQTPGAMSLSMPWPDGELRTTGGVERAARALRRLHLARHRDAVGFSLRYTRTTHERPLHQTRIVADSVPDIRCRRVHDAQAAFRSQSGRSSHPPRCTTRRTTGSPSAIPATAYSTVPAATSWSVIGAPISTPAASPPISTWSFPIDRLEEMAANGTIGSVSDVPLGFRRQSVRSGGNPHGRRAGRRQVPSSITKWTWYCSRRVWDRSARVRSVRSRTFSRRLA